MLLVQQRGKNPRFYLDVNVFEIATTVLLCVVDRVRSGERDRQTNRVLVMYV